MAMMQSSRSATGRKSVISCSSQRGIRRGYILLTTTCPPSSHLLMTYPVSSATNALNAVA